MGRRILAILTALSGLAAGCAPPYVRYGRADLSQGETPRPSSVFIGRRVVLVWDGISFPPLAIDYARLLATLRVFPPTATLSAGRARLISRGETIAADVQLATALNGESLLVVVAPETPPPADQLDLDLRFCVADDCEDLGVRLSPVPRDPKMTAWPAPRR